MAEIFEKDLEAWDTSVAATNPFFLKPSEVTKDKYITGEDLERSIRITEQLKNPVELRALAYNPASSAFRQSAESGFSAVVDRVGKFTPNVKNVVSQVAIQLLNNEPISKQYKEELERFGIDWKPMVDTSDQEKMIEMLDKSIYPMRKYFQRVLAKSTDDIRNREIVRELYNQSHGVDAEKWYNVLPGVIASAAILPAPAKAGSSIVRLAGGTRYAAAKAAENIARGVILAEEAGDFASETAQEYLNRTGDKKFENFTPKDASGLLASLYGYVSQKIEFMGDMDLMLVGAIKKVGVRSQLGKVAVVGGLKEYGEEAFQNTARLGFKKIEGTDKTWEEGMKEALTNAVYALPTGGVLAPAGFYVNRRNLVKGIKMAVPNITDAQAVQVADAMIDSAAESVIPDPTLRNDLRKKVAMMYETSEIDNKEGTIDAITDLEYSLIAADSAERGIDIAENPLFKGEVNELGWFREGIPENRRAEIQGYITELTDLKDQLKKLNEVEQKDWDKIDEIESKLDKFNAYVLDKLSDLARDDASAVRRILNETEQKYVAKEKERALDSFEATQEQKELAAGAASYVFDTLSKEGFDVQTVGGQGKKRAHGSSYLVIKRPGAADLKVRIGVTPIGTRHSAVALNLNAEKLSQEEMLNKIRELIKQKFVKSNKATNVNIGFDEEPTPMFQEQFDLADENARLDDIYPAYDGETIEVDGKERTVYNSEGKRIAKSAEALTNFWNWFGDSKVVDEQGRPLVVYHGTNAEFDTFDENLIGKWDYGFYGEGFYFTDTKYVAEDYAKSGAFDDGGTANVMPVYLNLQNPFFMDYRNDNGISDEKRNRLVEQGYDGVIAVESRDLRKPGYEDELDKAKALNVEHWQLKDYEGNVVGRVLPFEYVAWKSNQIKSVDNRGTFSSDTGNIYRQNRVSGGAPATYRGAYIPQYRFIQRSNRMDASTLSHELAHDWFEVNFARYRSGEATPDFMRAWGALEKALGIAEDATVAPRKASEAFARAYEGWIMNKTDWEKLINVDEKDKDAVIKLMQDYQNSLRDIYQDLTNQYFKETWGKLGELKPELKAWFDKVVNIQDLDRLVERGEMTEAQAQEEKLNRAIDTVIENTTDAETKQTLKEARTLNDTKRYEVEGGNKNALQERLSNLAREIDENNMIVKKDKYDTRRDMMKVAESADNFVKTRLDDALAIINGEMAEVEGLFKEDVYTALERLAVENGDLGLLNELKNSEIANRLAKELGQRVAGFRNWKQSSDLDVVSALKSLDNRFNKALENKKAQKQFNSALDLLDESLKNQDKIADKDLESILNELECQ